MKNNLNLPPNLTPKVYLKPENIEPAKQIDWRQTVIGRLCSKKSYELSRIIEDVKMNWALVGNVSIKLFNHRRNFYEFHLRSVEDFEILKQLGAWWLMEALVVLVECPIEGPQFIKEEQFSHTKIWMHIKNIKTRHITIKNLMDICSPAGKYIKHKKAYGRNEKEKNVEVLVDINVNHSLPFGTNVYESKAIWNWVEFSYKLFNLPLCKHCRWLDHSSQPCTKEPSQSMMDIKGIEKVDEETSLLVTEKTKTFAH